MVDMHMHTLYSDGDKTVETVLRMCEEKKLEYISITDHNTTKQYGDEALEKNIFTGKIIKGAEMNATFNNKKIEFLAYNIKNLEMINKWSSKFFSYEILKERFERDKNKIKEQKSIKDEEDILTKSYKASNIDFHARKYSK